MVVPRIRFSLKPRLLSRVKHLSLPVLSSAPALLTHEYLCGHVSRVLPPEPPVIDPCSQLTKICLRATHLIPSVITSLSPTNPGTFLPVVHSPVDTHHWNLDPLLCALPHSLPCGKVSFYISQTNNSSVTCKILSSKTPPFQFRTVPDSPVNKITYFCVICVGLSQVCSV